MAKVAEGFNAGKEVLTITPQALRCKRQNSSIETVRSMTKSYDLKVLNDGEWKVDFKGRAFGPYPSKDAAMEAANAAASKAASLGGEASVVVSPAS